MAAGEAVRNALPLFADRSVAGVRSGFAQIPALVERRKKRMTRFFEFCNRQLAENAFFGGAHFTIADITAFVTVAFAKRADITIPAECEDVVRWHEKIANRSSAKV